MEKPSGQLPSILRKEYGMKVTILLIMVWEMAKWVFT